MRRVVLIAVALIALAVPATALAHASLVELQPGLRQRLAQSPKQIVLTFDQPVDLVPQAVVVETAKGVNRFPPTPSPI